MKNALLMMALAALGLSMLAWWNVCHADDANVAIITSQKPTGGASPSHAAPNLPPFPLQMGVLHYRCHRTSGGATIIEPIESIVPNGDTAIPIIFNCVNCECGEEK